MPRLPLVLVLAAALTAGCTSGGGPYRPGDQGLDGVRHASTHRGGTLRIVDQVAVDSLDPGRSYLPHVWNLMRLYTRTLVTFAPAPGAGGRELVPDLATDLGTPSRGARTWTFRLRDGVRFEDGSPVTARDVKYGIERTFATDVLPGSPPYLREVLTDPLKPYTGPYSEPDRLGLDTVRTPDDRTIVFDLNQPVPDFPYLLQLPAAAPVPQAGDTGADYGKQPVSSGPYVVKEAGRRIVLARNPQWDPATDPVRTALPDTVTYTPGLSAGQVRKALADGHADLTLSASGVWDEKPSAVLADRDRAAGTDNPQTGGLRYVAIDAHVAPFGTPSCRRAVLYAADLTALRKARGGEYAGDLATSMYPPALAGYRADDPYGLAAHPGGQLARAREELRACGKPGGFAAKVGVEDSAAARASGEALATALRRVGIRLTVVPSVELGVPATVHREGLGLLVASWSADYPAPSGFFPPLVDGRIILARGNTNLAEVDSPAVNATLGRALSAPTLAAGTAQWQALDRLVMAEARFLPFLADRTLLYASPRVTNRYVSAGWGQYDLARLGVE
ncbi:MAG TPA: ABC transporter substrate-binding protein [Mycobacteriales bacterium]